MLSPVDIQNKQFKKSKLGGYNVEDVTEFFEQVIASYQELTNENYALKDKITILNESIQYYRSMEATIQNVLVLADKTAQDTKVSAYEKSEQIKKEAQQRAEKITYSAEERVNRILEKGREEVFELTQKVETLKTQYMCYRTQFKQLLQAQLEMLEKSEENHTMVQPDLLQELTSNEEEQSINNEVFKPINEVSEAIDENKDDNFYTKEYTPVADEELE